MKTLEFFGVLSGQSVNYDNSNIFFGKSISIRRHHDLMEVCGMKKF